MQTYLTLLRHILDHGRHRPNRTGVDTLSVFGYQARYDLRQGFPLLTTKKMFHRGMVEELLWFLRGDTNAKSLQAKGVHFWDEWATAEQCAKFGRDEGDLGPIYGFQYRHFGANYSADGERERGGFDQIAWLLNEIKVNPSSRRLIVTAWNPVDAGVVALPPCHSFMQFAVQGGELSCHLYQRSGDALLGVPVNLASYALLTHLIAHVSGLGVGDFIHSFGDLHLYENHLDQACEQLTRQPLPLPTLRLDPSVTDLFAFRAEHIRIEGYQSHAAITAAVSV